MLLATCACLPKLDPYQPALALDSTYLPGIVSRIITVTSDDQESKLPGRTKRGFGWCENPWQAAQVHLGAAPLKGCGATRSE